jgi:hypothetical protein
MRVFLAIPILLFLLAPRVSAQDPYGDPGATEQATPQESDAFDASSLDGLLLGEETLGLDFPLYGESELAPEADETSEPAGSGAAALTPEMEDFLDVPNWIQETSLKFGAGFHENPLLTHQNEEPSPFILFEAETMGIRLPQPGQGQFFVYGFGEYRRFLEVPDLDHEIIAMVQASYKLDLLEHLNWETLLQYAYNDRVFGLSPLEDELITTPLKVHQFSGKQGFTVNLPARLTLQTDFYLERNLFIDSDNDYWKPGSRFFLQGRLFNQSLRYQMGGEVYQRYYDERPARNLNRIVIPDSTATWTAYEPYLSLKWETSGENPFSIYTKVGYRWNTDNAQGYDDSTRAAATLRLNQEWNRWLFQLGGSVSHYQYPNRPVGRTDSRPSYISQWTGSFVVTRNFSPSLAINLGYGMEISQSLRETESYSANQVFLNLQSTF